MKLTKFQSDFVRRYNQDLKEGKTKTEFTACLCGEDNSVKFDSIYKTDRYGLWFPSVICHCCGLIQANPRLTSSEYVSFYQEDKYRLLYGDKDYMNSYETKFIDPHNRHIFQILDPLMKDRKFNSVLEFGCGGGWKLLPFHNAGYDATGYDFSPNLVSLGKKYGLNLHEGSTEDIKGGPYDVIVINHVVEHFTDFFTEMKNVLGNLKTEGLFYVGVPNIDNFAKDQFQNAHILYFTPRTFKYYMAGLGLRLIEFGDIDGGHMYGVFTLSEEKIEKDSLIHEYKVMKKVIFKGKITSLVGRILLKMRLKETVRKLIK